MSKKTSKPKAKKVKAEGAAPAVTHEQRSWIAKPGDGAACAAVWLACDALKAEGKELTFEALHAAVDSKTADSTIRTQRQRWRTFNG